MLSRTTRIQLLAFVVIAVLGIGYLSWNYVGLGNWLGTSGYTVNAEFSQAGGIFSNAEVDYRGVPVGRVGDVTLTASGVQVELDIDSNKHIPKDLEAIVTDRSVIGEQYVNLVPNTKHGPYLRDGSVIPSSRTRTPPPVSDLLLSTDEFAHSVPIGALQTTIKGLYDATQGVHDALQQLISSGKTFFTKADGSLTQTIDLIDTGKTVLATQNAQSTTLKKLASDLKQFGVQLQSSNGDISKVLSDTAPAANTVNTLFNQISEPLSGLLSNLVPTSYVFYANKNGVRSVLAQLPVAISIGGAVTTPEGINVGLVPTFFDPLPCTVGYEGTPVRPGLSVAGNPPLNTSAGCAAPPSSGQDVHGTQNAPR